MHCYSLRAGNTIGVDTHFFKICELFKMDYSAVFQAAKRFEQKSKVNDKIKESLQKVITALKEM
jgi:hypothetical protein